MRGTISPSKGAVGLIKRFERYRGEIECISCLLFTLPESLMLAGAG